MKESSTFQWRRLALLLINCLRKWIRMKNTTTQYNSTAPKDVMDILELPSD